MNRTIALTGANGFIGTELVQHLNSVGYKVLALVHRVSQTKITGVEYHTYNLSDELDVALFENVDTLIHLACSFTKPENGEPDINLIAAKRLLSLNLKHYIFISSFSASADTVSYYGKCKHELELIFDGHAIIRPGFVIGDGGLFSRLRTQIKHNPFVPLIDGGQQPVQIIALSDLMIAVEKILINEQTGIFNLASPNAITYKEMIVLASSSASGKPIFIPIPIPILRNIIRVARFFGKKNISEDNLDGLLNSRVVATTNDLLKLELNLVATAELMKKVTVK